MKSPLHKSVLAKELVRLLDLKKGQVVIDATLGLGGHAGLILEQIGHCGKLIGFEWDQDNAQTAEKNLQKFGKNCIIVQKNFIHLDEDVKSADRVLFDLGISSVHLDTCPRGFSFKRTEPLDMRMSLETKLTAYQIVNSFPEKELLKILWEYGEEKDARRIVRKILNYRRQKKIETTTELAKIIASVKQRGRWGSKNPATQTFQALRIAVNNELENVQIGLEKALKILKPNGIIAVISFHSLEDRIVKRLFREISRKCICPKEAPICTCQDRPKYELLTRKAIQPSTQEISENPRSRSARLRAIKKIT